jgi:hypothetical protein
LKYWDGSRVEAEGGWQGAREAHPLERAVTTERRRQLPFCLAPSTVALILALAGVARLAEITADIDTALRALANAKIHRQRDPSQYFNGLLTQRRLNSL